MNTALRVSGPGLGTIVGRVLDGAHRPLSGVKVSLVGNAYVDGRWIAVERRSVAANVRGEYMIDDVEPGEYRVLARAAAANGGTSGNPAAVASTFFPATTTLAEAERLTIARGQERDGVDITTAAASVASVSGAIFSPERHPLARATITLTNVDSPLEQYTADTTADGTFTFAGVEAGPYNLFARGPESDTPAVAFQSIAVPVSGLTGIQVMTSPGGTALGQVVVGDGVLSASERARLRVVAVAVAPGSGGTFRHAAVAGYFRGCIRDPRPYWFADDPRRRPAAGLDSAINKTRRPGRDRHAAQSRPRRNRRRSRVANHRTRRHARRTRR